MDLTIPLVIATGIVKDKKGLKLTPTFGTHYILYQKSKNQIKGGNEETMS